ncbi:hypothetical protein [Krasilnikovia sp. MM14-A1004]|uniref:hypothetical protein n=1 Tax=Krasilnikovia sp. MM14-A1004 TaxID=3373541 RepID=UPI00399C8282
MIRFSLDQTVEGWVWRLISRTDCAADLIARSGPPATDHTAAMHELALLGHGPTPRIVGSDDGHWWWLLPAPDGTIAAQCPAVHRSPVACREAFTDARRAAVAVLRRHGHEAQCRTCG